MNTRRTHPTRWTRRIRERRLLVAARGVGSDLPEVVEQVALASVDPFLDPDLLDAVPDDDLLDFLDPDGPSARGAD